MESREIQREIFKAYFWVAAFIVIDVVALIGLGVGIGFLIHFLRSC